MWRGETRTSDETHVATIAHFFILSHVQMYVGAGLSEVAFCGRSGGVEKGARESERCAHTFRP